jgi:hypothetical protein
MTTKILGSQIENFSITTEKLAANVTATYATTAEVSNYATSAQFSQFATSFAPKITSVNVANSSFALVDDTAIGLDGGYVVVTGNNFQSGATVLIDTTPALAVTRVNNTTLNVQLPPQLSNTYSLYVVNPDGGTGIRVSALTYSAFPVWLTPSPLANQTSGIATTIQLQAFTAPSSVSYALADGSTLPPNTTLLANGFLYGTVTTLNDTTYSFDVVATDSELQNTTKTFSISVINRPEITSVAIANATYTVLNDTAVNTGGGFIVITGNHFKVGASVSVLATPATLVTRVDNTRLNVQVAARAAGTYNVSVTNSDGRVGNLINGLVYSPEPVWANTSPLPTIVNNRAFARNFSAPPATSYTVVAGSLPSGSTLLSNGYFFGTVSIGADTNYTFDINANDAENQDVTRSFSLPGVAVANELYGWSGAPTLIGTDVNWSSISTGSGRKTNGALFGYLTNTNGELGTNNTVSQNPPVQIGADTDWSFVASGGGHTAAVKTGGTLWTWGLNTAGNLGNLNRVSRSSPAQVGAATDWARVATSSLITHAIKTTGTMWAWGSNSNGQLGTNNLLGVGRSSPTQIGTDTNWSRVSNTTQSGMAIRTTGTLWAWGSNIFGNLGLGNRNDSLVPLQVGALTNWAEVFVDSQGFVARKTDGTMWACGVNTAGQLGINNIISRSSPVQVGTDTNWSQVGMVSNRVKAIRTNGQLWYVASAASSPTQIGSASGLTWKQLNTGGSQSSIAG